MRGILALPVWEVRAKPGEQVSYGAKFTLAFLCVLPLTRAVIAVQNPKGMFSMVHAEIGGFKGLPANAYPDN